ncbi:MAG: tripartite tricarboxylate transporter substrate-binding protein [Tardiphaga sp.]
MGPQSDPPPYLRADLPTIAEQGYPGYGVDVWFGVFAPAKTPRPIVDWLSALLMNIIAAPDTKGRLLQLGLEPVGGTQEAFVQTIADEKVIWTNILGKAGIGALE